MIPVDTQRNPGARRRASFAPARHTARKPPRRRILTAMALAPVAFVIPTGTASAAAAVPPTLPATLVTVAFATPVGPYSIPNTDNIEVTLRAEGLVAPRQSRFGNDGPEANDCAETEPDSAAWSVKFQRFITKLRPTLSRIFAGIVIIAVALELISRTLQYFGRKAKRRRWVPHVVSTLSAIVVAAYLHLGKGVAAIELYAAAALLGIGPVVLVQLVGTKKGDGGKTDSSETDAMPDDMEALRECQEDFEFELRALVDRFGDRVDFVAEKLKRDLASDPDSSSDRSPTQ